MADVLCTWYTSRWYNCCGSLVPCVLCLVPCALVLGPGDLLRICYVFDLFCSWPRVCVYEFFVFDAISASASHGHWRYIWGDEQGASAAVRETQSSAPVCWRGNRPTLHLRLVKVHSLLVIDDIIMLLLFASHVRPSSCVCYVSPRSCVCCRRHV